MKRLTPLTLALALAACGTVQSDNGNNVVVSADTSAITLASDGTSEGSTAYTFTNPAGAKPTSVTSATVSWGTGAEQSKTVTIPAVSLPAGLTCAAAATNPSAVCDYNVTGTTFGARSIKASISDSTLFASAYAANPSAKNLPVTVTFNGAANAVNFALSVSSNTTGTGGETTPVEEAPAPVLQVVGNGPFSGNMSVNVSGNFDANSEADRIVLQITDSNGVIDNTSYTTTQARATFSVDTTKFANGNIKLQVIAYTKSNLRGISIEKAVQVQNLTSPDLAVASPADGATVTTPLVPVRVTLTKRSANYTVNPQTIGVDVLDYRGVVVLQKTLSTVDTSTCTGDTDSLTCNTQFDMAGLPADTYTVRIRTSVIVDPAGANVTRSLETSSRFTTNTSSVLPPAATIRFPAITDNRTAGRIDSVSGIVVNVSDNSGVVTVEGRVVGPFDATKPLALNGTAQCRESQPVATTEAVDVLLLNYGLNPAIQLGDVVLPTVDIDGSAYVPDNNDNERYDFRVTTIDTEGNRNIQCIPILIDRAKTAQDRAANSNYDATKISTTPDSTPGELNYTTGTWTLSGINKRSRVAAVLYLNGTQQSVTFNNSVVGSTSVSVGFGEVGTYQIVWLVEDMTTGIVTSVSGGYVNVKRNPS